MQRPIVLPVPHHPVSLQYSNQDLLDNLPFAVYTCDLAGYITQYNSAAVALWGREPQLGKDLWCGSWRLFRTDGSEMPLDECPMSQCLKLGTPVSGQEIIIQRPDGSLRNVTPFPNPLRSSDESMIGAINVLVDVTDQKSVNEKAAHMAAIVQSSDDAIISKTLEGIVTSWNASAERIFGYKAEEMIGQPIVKLIPLDRQDEEPEILKKLRKGERVDHFETKRITKNGTVLDISLTISAVRDTEGKIIGASKVARDITEQKRTERIVRENEERFRMAVESTKLGTWEFIPKTGVLSLSDEGKNIYRLPMDQEISYEEFLEFVIPEDRSILSEAVKKALDPSSGGTYNLEFRIRQFNRQEISWIRSQGKIFFNERGEPEKYIGTVLDITEDMGEMKALENLVTERTAELKQLNLELEQSNKELEQFAYAASHDLQEPLRKISAFGDILKSRFRDELPGDASDLIDRMQSASFRMRTLIDGLLSYSRVSFNLCEMERIDLNKLASEVLDDMETTIREKNAKIHVDNLDAVKGEPTQLRQLFQNIIGNSLKFTDNVKLPEILISSETVSGRDSGLAVARKDEVRQFQLIKFKDNGIGFEQEYASRIFRLFERLHGRDNYSGSGMGLSIVQKVVANHGGYVAAKSNPGEGAVFLVLLPLD